MKSQKNEDFQKILKDMNKTLKFKIATDVVMTVLLLFLMSYQLAGDTAHEWLGVALFVAFIVHHILNRRWIAGIIKGKYSVMRVIQTVLADGGKNGRQMF